MGLKLVATFLAVAIAPLAAAGGLRFIRIANTGDLAPIPEGGASFQSFADAPLIGDGKILFRGRFPLDGYFFLDEATGTLMAGITAGANPDGGPGTSLPLVSSFTPYYGPNATVVVTASLQGVAVTSDNNYAMVGLRYPNLPGCRIVAREGDYSGISDWKLSDWWPGINVNAWNYASFNGGFTGTGVDNGNRDNVWSTHSGGRPLFRQGQGNDPVPGYPSNTYFVGFNRGVNAMNDFGITTVFATTYTSVQGTPGTHIRHLMIRGQGMNSEMASTNTSAPGLHPLFRFRMLKAPVRLTSGSNPLVVFPDDPRADGSESRPVGFWAWRAGVLSKVVISGDVATSPAGLVVNPDISDFTLNSMGWVAFEASLSGLGTTAANDAGIVVANPQESRLQVRYREGDILVGMPTGHGVTSFELPGLDENGRLAFVANYSDGVSAGSGLWVETPDGLRLICRTGGTLKAPGEPPRTVNSFAFQPGSHGSDIGMNGTSPSGWSMASGAVAMRVSYTDGSQAVWKVETNANLSPPQLVVSSDGELLPSDGTALLDFGEAVPGLSTIVRRITLTNLGELPLTGISFAKLGEAIEDFMIDAPDLGSLEYGDSREWVLRFAPTVSGPRAGSLRIESQSGEVFDITLSGVGLTGEAALSMAISSAGLTGEAALPSAIPFNDGVDNLLKYAFNMNLAGSDVSGMEPGSGTSGLPSITTTGSGEITLLCVEFVRRKGSGLVYSPQKSSTLTPDSFSPFTVSPIVTSIDDQWERVNYDEPIGDTETTCFGRVEVSLP